MKRKAESPAESPTNGTAAPEKKAKHSLSAEEARGRFRRGLFDKAVLETYTKEYAASTPYKHAVIHELVNDKLLRSVRDEVRENLHFTRKETDIYKIFQSGDLANLDGLDDESLAKLPSLLALRDAMYSDTFRNYVSSITGCGPLSGKKTDMALNVYIPSCFLLCHDDVIGSRRVSYILYLTDPDKPWQPEWGGALRLYPVQEMKSGDEVAKTPLPDSVKSIPPAWNQLSFFAVQPGESFHDVEEVYHVKREMYDARVRMAISGWFHIPQAGEEGFVEGEEEKNARNSSLMQLQGNPAQYDAPQAKPIPVDGTRHEDTFDEADLEFLLKYIAPTYLTPRTLKRVSRQFGEMSSITLADILCKKFAKRLKDHIEAQERASPSSLASGSEAQTATAAAAGVPPDWKVAKPPHKHRYLYQQPSELRAAHEESPITELVDILLPSRQFRQWLRLATGCTIRSHDVLARRFRRGSDYALATGYAGKHRLEVGLGITPTPDWGGDAGRDKESEPVGGEEVYLAEDEDEDGQGTETDAAVYQTGDPDDDDDNVLFFQYASWNKLTIVLRDGGTLKFVKYVNRNAKGDRWDVSGTYEIDELEEDDDSDDYDDEDGDAKAGGSTGKKKAKGGAGKETEQASEGEEFKGFSSSDDSDSD
ncbi:Oxoglutarate/iron-dependent oxygenase, C-terminal degradation domain protein [Moelleriella libera RCEF 2490]|uniref:uS12 prolyl 3,4-dihydroxylase n=1 Tax=Moelleriella libera RCEF 2490 TaxID=1081109 RepID=A0A168C279_9HYPO|nr:Oxoglutarate/iron-dependent oxygenase, C-terminal degradation domain protein [Moelleriella libera RCEF 2490]